MIFNRTLLGCLLFSAAALVAKPQDLADAPDGASIKLLPDGGYQVIAVGSGTYDFNDPDDILDARKAATMRAKAAIAKFLKEEISAQEGMDEAFKEVEQVSSDGTTQITTLSRSSVKQMMEAIRISASALLAGVVVLQDAKIPAEGSEGGTIRVMVGVSSKTTAAATAAANGIGSSLAAREAAPVSAPAAADAVPGDASAMGALAGGGEVPAGGDSAASAAPDGWITCVGVGSDRKSAVQQALAEGIAQVYGQKLQQDERMSERMTKFKANASIMGKKLNATTKTSTKQTETNTLTQTAGFVREYRIVQVVPKDGNQEATVHAYIVNPRAGGTAALMVCKPTMRLEGRTTVYQLGPKRRLSGAEVAQAVLFALPTGLERANKFLILNDQSINAVVENKTATDAMVSAGLAGPQELMQLGQGLTPDYSLRTEVTEIKYTKKLGQDKATKKFGQQHKLVLKLNATLLNDRTGQAVKSTPVTLLLEDDEIKALLAEDEDADLLQAALTKLADPIAEWIGAGK